MSVLLSYVFRMESRARDENAKDKNVETSSAGWAKLAAAGSRSVSPRDVVWQLTAGRVSDTTGGTGCYCTKTLMMMRRKR